MQTITSYERHTGMGARHGTQIKYNGIWYFISEMSEARYIRRDNGFEVYEMDMEYPWNIRAYHRSNSGNEAIAEGYMCVGYDNDIPVIR